MTTRSRDEGDLVLDDVTEEPVGFRERRCAATGDRLSEDKLLRFALDPAGIVIPDVAAKLPGRGVWTLCTRVAVETAARKGGFARGFKKSANAPAGLADQAESLLARRCLDFLGIARGAGDVILGADAVETALRKAKPAWLFEASDGSADGRDKILGLAFGLWGRVSVAGCFTSEELGVALGRDRVVHGLIPVGRIAHRWTVDIGRLSGFRVTTPADWRQNNVD